MKALKLVVLLVISLALMGCFESLILLRVNKDGSGTIEETVVISDAFMELMKSFGGQEEAEQEEEEDLVDEEQLAEKASSMGADVRLVSAEPVKTDRGAGYKAIYSFSDINKIQINQNPGENVTAPSMGGEEEQPVEEWLRFKFSGGSTATLDILYPQDVEVEQEEESSEGEVDMESNPEMMEMMRQLYQDMHIGIAVEVDGRITETNASYVEDSTVTLMDVDFAKILEDEQKFKDLLSANPNTIEEMKEVIQDNPGIKVEIQENIQIRFSLDYEEKDINVDRCVGLAFENRPELHIHELLFEASGSGFTTVYPSRTATNPDLGFIPLPPLWVAEILVSSCAT